MDALADELIAFRRRKDEELGVARQNVAFFLATGVDLSKAMAASAGERSRIILRLTRLLERERLRGMRRHWCYDLNRHIALKQALDRLNVRAARNAKGGSCESYRL